MLSASRPHLAYLSAKSKKYSRCNTWVASASSLTMYLRLFCKIHGHFNSGLSPEQLRLL